MGAALQATLEWSLSLQGWMFFDTAMIVLIAISWPYRTPSDLDDPAYYFSRSWRAIPMAVALLFGLCALSWANEADRTAGMLISILLIISVLMAAIVSPRGKHYIAKQLQARQRRKKKRYTKDTSDDAR